MSIFSQKKDSLGSNEFYQKMNNTLNLRMGIGNDVNSFVYFLPESILYVEPNTSLKATAAINYRFI